MPAPRPRAPVAPDLLRSRARQHPDRVAINVAGAATLTFGDWERRSNAAARHLRDLGVGRGTRVALLFDDTDWIDYAVAYFGVLKAGGTAVHLGVGLPTAELHRRLAQTAPTGLVHGNAAAPLVDVAWVRPVRALGGGKHTPIDVTVKSADIADILYTSGTTGPAKAFTNPHGTLTFRRGPAGLTKLDVSAPMLAPMPMGTPSSAMSIAMLPLISPSTVVLCRPDNVERMGALIAEHGIATMLITPWIAQRIVAAHLDETYDLRTVTTIAVASAALPAATATALGTMIPGVTITSAYAQGEAVPAVILATYDPARPTAVGRPARGTRMQVVDPQGEPVPDGQVGEIWLRSAAPKRRYLDNALNRAIRVAGWTRTRDLGYVGADGDLYLFDRAVDAIRTEAGLVSSIAVEGALYDHPAVREAAVVGDGGPDGYQKVVAVVVLDPPDAARRVRAALKRRLAPHQVPAAFEIVDALPRGVTGKVLKHQLRARLASRRTTDPPTDPTNGARDAARDQRLDHFGGAAADLIGAERNPALGELRRSGGAGRPTARRVPLRRPAVRPRSG